MDWKSKDVGAKDFTIGFGTLALMAVVAIVIAIISGL